MWCHLSKKNGKHFNLVEKTGLWARKMGYKVPRALGTIWGHIVIMFFSFVTLRFPRLTMVPLGAIGEPLMSRGA
jgi:hypothetical protein